MSIETFKNRAAENVPGKFYVGYWCTDCDLCRATAPANFGRIGRSSEWGGYSYVMKQPASMEEVATCMEAMEHCCVQAIFADGERFDWTVHPAPVSDHLALEVERRLPLPQGDEAGCRCKAKQDGQGRQP